MARNEWWTEVRKGRFRHGVLGQPVDRVRRSDRVQLVGEGDAHRHRVDDVELSGEPVEINGTAILRMRDGKIVEHWGGPHCQGGLGLIR